MNWRPDGYENPYNPRNSVLEKMTCEIYEAGADAILKALRKESYTLRIADRDIDIPGFDIVFIPEEE